jgi:hypothetical protein
MCLAPCRGMPWPCRGAGAGRPWCAKVCQLLPDVEGLVDRQWQRSLYSLVAVPVRTKSHIRIQPCCRTSIQPCCRTSIHTGASDGMPRRAVADVFRCRNSCFAESEVTFVLGREAKAGRCGFFVRFPSGKIVSALLWLLLLLWLRLARVNVKLWLLLKVIYMMGMMVLPSSGKCLVLLKNWC